MKKPHIEAHKHSSAHRSSLEKDQVCGCFYCLSIFSPQEIEEWISDKGGDTAICPYCGIDSIIGAGAGYPINQEFLTKMKNHWFGWVLEKKYSGLL